MTMGLRIKQLRKQRNMTLKALGEQTCLSPSFLCDVEQGRTKPSLKRLEVVADALNTSVAYLVGEDSNSQKIPQSTIDTVQSLSESEIGIEILRLLSDLNGWSDEDKQELLHYLQVKKLLRNTDRSTETL